MSELFPPWSVKNMAASGYDNLYSSEQQKQFLLFYILINMWNCQSLSNFSHPLTVKRFLIIVLMCILLITNKIVYLPPGIQSSVDM